MSSHIPHPNTREHGLHDGCPRCAEHAAKPFDGLDDENLGMLVGRVACNMEPRSVLETEAMARIVDAMTYTGRMLRSNPMGLRVSLSRNWGIPLEEDWPTKAKRHNLPPSEEMGIG
jgi:hypothetical protein